MGKISYKKLKGSQNLRQRLVLALLSSTPVHIEDIHAEETWPGLRPHEVSFIRLLEKVCDDCSVEINDTGTKLKFKPGIVMGGRNLVHECFLSRAIGYYLEPLIVLGLFAKKPLNITLKDQHGGGEVLLSVPVVQSLTVVTWTDEGMVKRIRGITFSTRVAVQFENTMVYAARGIFNPFLPDVHIFTDHRQGAQAGKSPGYGISLVAETTSGCCISTDTAVSYSHQEETAELEDEEKKELMSPEDVGVQMATVLLGEIEQGGVIDSTHQGLLFLLCALCPQDVSKVRVGKLSPYGIETLRNIKDFLGVTFVIKPDPSTGTVILNQSSIIGFKPFSGLIPLRAIRLGLSYAKPSSISYPLCACMTTLISSISIYYHTKEDCSLFHPSFHSSKRIR